jgi:1-acyl-sn-glycerol-3-phosphate acyltransferase
VCDRLRMSEKSEAAAAQSSTEETSRAGKGSFDAVSSNMDQLEDATIRYPFVRHPQTKNKLQYLLQWFILVISVGIIILLCAVLNVIQTISFLLGRFKGFRKWSQIGVTFGGGFAWSWFHITLELISGLKLEYSGDEIPLFENAVCIGNHVSDMDPFLILGLAMRRGMLGNCRFLAKKAVRRIPFIGWGLYLMGTVFLERNWQNDKEALYKSFRHLTINHLPFWLVSFLEGTRINNKNLQEARVFARKTGLAIPRVTLIPRVKGFSAMLKELQKNPNVKYIYDFTFGYCDGIFTNSDFMSRSLRGYKICVNVKRIPISEIPLENDEQLKRWVFDRFYRKDEMLYKLSQMPVGNRYFEGEKILETPFKILDWTSKPYEHISEISLESKKTQ